MTSRTRLFALAIAAATVAVPGFVAMTPAQASAPPAVAQATARIDPDTTPPTIEGVGKLFRVALYDFTVSWIVSDPESDVDGVRQWIFTRTPDTGWTSLTTDWEPPAVASDYPSQPDGQTTCLRGQARNGFGTFSDWSDAYCIHTPLDDSELTATSAWKSVTSTGLWFGSAFTTKKNGARLTLPGVQDADRLGVVATRCPSCGKVGVYVGTTKVGVLRLAADDFETQDVQVLPRLATRLDGKLRLVVESVERKVQIDGLVVTGPPAD